MQMRAAHKRLSPLVASFSSEEYIDDTLATGIYIFCTPAISTSFIFMRIWIYIHTNIFAKNFNSFFSDAFVFLFLFCAKMCFKIHTRNYYYFRSACETVCGRLWLLWKLMPLLLSAAYRCIQFSILLYFIQYMYTNMCRIYLATFNILYIGIFSGNNYICWIYKRRLSYLMTWFFMPSSVWRRVLKRVLL